MSDGDWEPYKNGFKKGNIAVFPAIGVGAWQVWEYQLEHWLPVVPIIYATREVRTHDRTCSPPYQYWQRTREETIAEVQRLAEEYAKTLT